MKLKNACSALVIVLCVSTALSAQAQTLSVLYTFTGGADGGSPVGGLIRDAEGNLYGTTCCDGAHGAGTVFMLDTGGNETVLYSFTGGADGDQPYASLIRDAKGNIYGTTFFGGGSAACNGGCGVVFKLDTSGEETVLHAFTGTGGDGANPYDGLVQDAQGDLYGTTVSGGGSSACSGGCGVVFGVNTAGKEKDYSLRTFWGENQAVDVMPKEVCAVTDAQGQFEFPSVPPDVLCRLFLEHPDYATLSLFTSTAANPPATQSEGHPVVKLPLSLTLHSVRKIKVQVRSKQDDKPLAGVRIVGVTLLPRSGSPEERGLPCIKAISSRSTIGSSPRGHSTAC